MCRLQATRLWVGGGGFGVPRQQFGAESVQLPPANLTDEVVLLEGILLHIIVFFWPIAVVVDVLLMTLNPGRAQQGWPAAKEHGALFGQTQQRASRVLAVDHLVAEHVDNSWGEV